NVFLAIILGNTRCITAHDLQTGRLRDNLFLFQQNNLITIALTYFTNLDFIPSVKQIDFFYIIMKLQETILKEKIVSLCQTNRFLLHHNEITRNYFLNHKIQGVSQRPMIIIDNISIHIINNNTTIVNFGMPLTTILLLLTLINNNTTIVRHTCLGKIIWKINNNTTIVNFGMPLTTILLLLTLINNNTTIVRQLHTRLGKIIWKDRASVDQWFGNISMVMSQAVLQHVS
ncbi:hypothetical protein ACJX0J_038045, partial [Zea mays]